MRYEVHFLHEGLSIGNDVWIPHDFQKMDFHQCFLDLFLVHFWNVDDFHDVLLFVFLIFDKDSVAKATLSHDVNFTIFLHDLILKLTVNFL